MKINLGKKEIIHFIGIGGIGMSGLALIMKQLGFKIQGRDISVNKKMKNLNKIFYDILLKLNNEKSNLVLNKDIFIKYFEKTL